MRKDAKLRSRHGLNALMARVKVRGLAAIDGRTLAAKALIRWKQELIHDLGGEVAVSAQKMALVDVAVRTRLYLDHTDAFLLSQAALIDRRRKAMLPILRERAQLADSLQRQLQALGLERVEIDGGRLPESWVERVQPRREPDLGEAEDSAAVPRANGTAPREAI